MPGKHFDELDDFEYMYVAGQAEPERRARPNYGARRGGCLTAWLLVLAVTNVLAVLFLALLQRAAISANGLFSIGVALVILVGVVALWYARRWGYLLILMMYGLNLALVPVLLLLARLDFVFVVGSVVPSLIGLIVLVSLVNRRRRLFA